MDERPDQLERHIEDRRNRLNEDISELKRKAQDTVDWRVQFEQRPGKMLGLAFGAGMLLAAVIGSPRRSTRPKSTSKRPPEYGASSEKERSDFPTAKYAAEYGGRAGTQTWGNIKDALVGFAVTKCENLVEDLLPGITDEYRKAELRNRSDDAGSSNQRVH
jgi:hypothetical protein